MFSLDHIARFALASAGALVLSTASVLAAVGPGQTVQPVQLASSSGAGTIANG